jgi:hypothetical protein
MEKPLSWLVPARITASFGLTLFVTVLANFCKFAMFPFSHKSSVYISRILVPICLFVKMELGSGTLSLLISKAGDRAGRLGVTEAELGRLGSVPCLTLGVRDVEAVGRCKAYVINRASNRNTSADKLHLTNVPKAFMKLGNTSARKLSAFRASRNRFMIPTQVSHLYYLCQRDHTHSN